MMLRQSRVYTNAPSNRSTYSLVPGDLRRHAATEAAFKAQPLANFEIIHIAAHGIASPKFPDRAALVLGSDPRSGEDGLLQLREIRDLSLNADLVTPSACDTSVGPLEGRRASPTSAVRSCLPARSR